VCSSLQFCVKLGLERMNLALHTDLVTSRSVSYGAVSSSSTCGRFANIPSAISNSLLSFCVYVYMCVGGTHVCVWYVSLKLIHRTDDGVGRSGFV
jgi:hypothetical protein